MAKQAENPVSRYKIEPPGHGMRSIGVRLFLSFICVIFFLVVQGAVAIYTTRHIADVQYDSQQAVLAIKALDEQLAYARILIFRLLGTKNPLKMDAFKDQFSKNMDELARQFKANAISNEMLAEAEKTYLQIIQYHYDFFFVLARDLVTKQSSRQYESLRSILKSRLNTIESESSERVTAARSRALRLTIGLCAAALLTAAIWALALKNSLTDRKLAEQNLREAHDQLELRVDERTAELKRAKEKAEQASRLAQERASEISRQATFIHTVLDNITDGIVACDGNGTLTLFNRAIREIHGIEQRELPPDQWASHYDLYLADGKTLMKTEDIPLYRAFQGERVRNVEMVIAPKNSGKRDLLASGQPITDDDGTKVGAVASMHDITDRKRAEAQLVSAKEEAERANRAKSEFLANMSHEIRTPMNTILGFAQLMQRDAALSDTQHENLEIINRSGEHLLALINDVLRISQIEAGRVTLESVTFNLHAFLWNLESMFRMHTDDEGLQFQMTGVNDVPRYVTADKNKLRQVLSNILGNAVKFTPSGSIEMQVGVAGQTPREVRLSFEIRDTGVGMATDELKHVFGYFEQTAGGRQSQTGAGLGLAISRDYVRMMGGDISVSSHPGRGSTFRFDIAVMPGDRDACQRPQTAGRVTGLAQTDDAPRILVAEDDKVNRMLLVKLLETVGFEVHSAPDGKAALAIFERLRPDFIWMDIRMPVMDGLEATRRIRKTPAGRKCIIAALTAHALEEEQERILAAGCDEVLSKPYDEQALFAVMARYLGVQYIFDAAHAPNADPEPPTPLSIQQLSALPDELKRRLHRAALELNTHGVLAVIDEIGHQDAAAASILKNYARKFDYERILDLIQNRDGKKEADA